jgi:hypothetical protein
LEHHSNANILIQGHVHSVSSRTGGGMEIGDEAPGGDDLVEHVVLDGAKERLDILTVFTPRPSTCSRPLNNNNIIILLPHRP